MEVPYGDINPELVKDSNEVTYQDGADIFISIQIGKSMTPTQQLTVKCITLKKKAAKEFPIILNTNIKMTTP